MVQYSRSRRSMHVLVVFLVIGCIASAFGESDLYLAKTTYSAGNGRITYSYVLDVSDPGALVAGVSRMHMTGMAGVLAQGDALSWRNAGVTATSAQWLYEMAGPFTRFAYFDIIADGDVSEPGPVSYDVEGEGGTAEGPVAKSTPTTYEVSGTTFADSDDNGVYDSGDDDALVGVTVELLDSEGSVVATTTSNGAIYDGDEYLGNYRFDDVAPGDYTVRAPGTVAGPDGELTANTPSEQAVSVVDASVSGVDFGYTPEPEYTVSGTVFIDWNRNGVYQPPDEDRLADVEVELLNDAGQVLATATSIADPILSGGGQYVGNYLFEDVPAGSYTVRAPLAVGNVDQLEITTAPEVAVVVADAPFTGVDFGYVDPNYQGPIDVEVLAYVFFDVNRNGQFDAFELSLEEVGVTLTGGPSVVTLQTDGDGLADFGTHDEGDYSIAVTDGGGYGLLEYWTATTADSYDFAIDADTESPLVFYFGYYPDICAIVTAIGHCEITGTNNTIGFWKDNAKLAMQGRTKGAQVTSEALLQYLAAVEALGPYEEPFDLGDNTLWKAFWYLHPGLSGNSPLEKLDRHLLAAELNWVSGYSSSMPKLERVVLWWAEYVRNEDQGLAGRMAWFLDVWNNLGDGNG